MRATKEDPAALDVDSHADGNRSAAFHIYQQTPARRAATSNAVPFVRLRHLARPVGRINSNDYDLSRLVDFNSGDMHTGRADGLDCPGHVLLAECGGRTGHG